MERLRPQPEADERTTLSGWLDWQRATVRRKLDGLADEDGYRPLLPTSPTMTIAGVTSHLRWTEWGWFARSFPSSAGSSVPPVGDPSGWTFEKRPLQVLVAEYEEECERSSRVVSGLDLDQLQEYTPVGFTPVCLRWIIGHMIEETARHLGHLDILREMTDGTRSY